MRMENRMQRLKMKNNKIRFKSMKKSSPLAQYKRMILGKHYRNGLNSIAIPKAIQERVKEQWLYFQKTLMPVKIRAVRTCDDRIKFEFKVNE